MSTSAPPRPRLEDQCRTLATFVGDLSGMPGAFRRLYDTYGPAVDIGFGPSRMICLLGPEANEHILASAYDAFAWGPAMKALEPIDGRTAIVLSDGDEHDRRRRLVQPAFAKRQVDARLDAINDEMESMVARWHVGDRFDAHVAVRGVIRRILLRSLFGSGLGADADRIGDLLGPMLAFVQKNPSTRLEVDLKWNAFARALRHRDAADAIVRSEVERRRLRTPEPDDAPSDVLDRLLAGVEGEHLDDTELHDQVRSLVAAGFHSTANQAAWIMVELGRHRWVLDAVRDEVDGVLGDRSLTIADLARMPMVDGVVRETMRLWPAGFVVPRWSVRPSTFAGCEIPADRLVCYSPVFTHRMAESWDDPDEFDPGRWVTRERRSPDWDFVPFGGGRRHCIGFALATLELQALVVTLARRVHWRAVRDRSVPVGLVSNEPRGGVPVEITAA